MFCGKCGKPNKDDSNFCVYCGNEINARKVQPQNNDLQPISSKSEADLLYYQASLKMQQEALYLQQQQFIEQQKQFASMVKCPRCGATSLASNKKGYGVGKGVVGGLIGVSIAGPIGLIGLTAGNIGAKKIIVTCINCGKRFKVSKK